MIAEKTFASMDNFIAALDALGEMFMHSKYEYGAICFLNERRTCSCGQCCPGYELDEAATADLAEKKIRIDETPEYSNEKKLNEFIEKHMK